MVEVAEPQPGGRAGLLAILSLGNFAIGMGAFVVIGILSPLASNLAMSNAEAGLVVPLFSLLPFPEALLAAAMFGWSVVGWSFMVPQQARLIELVPQQQNVVLSLNSACIYLGASLGSALGAVVISTWSIAASGAAAAISTWSIAASGAAAAIAMVAAFVHLLLPTALQRK
jgi:predicted MFS family arabinose efflux permease